MMKKRKSRIFHLTSHLVILVYIVIYFSYLADIPSAPALVICPVSSHGSRDKGMSNQVSRLMVTFGTGKISEQLEMNQIKR